MNGLQVFQTSRSFTNYFQQNPTGTPSRTTATASGPTYINCGSAFQYLDIINAVQASAPEDLKIYMRQLRVMGVMCNNSNTPVYVQRIKFVVRKNIPQSEFTNFGALLTANADPTNPTPIAEPLVDYTVSNTAQRYLKFLGTKYFKMPCGSMRKFKMNKKWRAPKLITKDIEGDFTKYFALKGQVVFAFKVIPFIQPIQVGTFPTQAYENHSWASWLLTFRVVDYYSAYAMGLNDPKNTFVPQGLAAGSTRVAVPTDQQFVQQSISGNASG